MVSTTTTGFARAGRRHNVGGCVQRRGIVGSRPQFGKVLPNSAAPLGSTTIASLFSITSVADGALKDVLN